MHRLRPQLLARTWLLLPLFTALLAPSTFAADTTAPTTPVVTDDGVYTTDATSLHAVWTSADPESGIVEYQYLIRQTSTSGPIILNWTSTGATASVTSAGLSLIPGQLYYFQVKARNGVNLWSSVGSSNGIKVDTTPPSIPTQPTEGGTTDLDYDTDGSYRVYWVAATDAESGIAAYELQERAGTSGTWTTLTSTTTSAYFSVSSRLQNTQYFYQVRAKNKAGLWSAFSAVSDGIFIDKTAPTAITTVTDDGTVNASSTSLHAIWTASTDPESGLAQYEYILRQDTTSGPIMVNYTPVGLVTEFTITGLSLIQGKLYYLGIRAKNNAGLYTAVKYSDGIRAPDATPPTAPGQPTEGSPDTDYDGDGAYTIAWPAASDPDSGIAAYELQQRIGTAGTWTTLSSALTTTSSARSGLTDKLTYFYQVRAKNNVGTWGPFSLISDGVLIDKTAPTAVATVTDDGVTTPSLTQLHATWTASSDAESGIADYQYEMLQDSTAGSVIVPWTAAGSPTTGVTKTGLSLINGKSYFFGIRAVNGSGLLSATIRYSDGIQVQSDVTPPTGTITINNAASSTNNSTVTLTISATDNSGTVSQMQCSNDNVTYSAAEAYATSKAWTLPSGDGPKTVWVKFSDPSGNWSTPVGATITLDTTPPAITVTFPQDGAVLGVP